MLLHRERKRIQRELELGGGGGGGGARFLQRAASPTGHLQHSHLSPLPSPGGSGSAFDPTSSSGGGGGGGGVPVTVTRPNSSCSNVWLRTLESSMTKPGFARSRSRGSSAPHFADKNCSAPVTLAGVMTAEGRAALERASRVQTRAATAIAKDILRRQKAWTAPWLLSARRTQLTRRTATE